MGKSYRPGRFDNFLNAFGAARLLLQKAHENGCLLEGLVLYASIIDGLCRIALVLKEQLENRISSINESYIYQTSETEFYSERRIFNLAHQKGILSDELHKEISWLYDIRNKAIHRFFTSEIEYAHLEIVLGRYEVVYQRLCQLVYELESEQIRNKVGMAMATQESADKERIIREAYRKINSGSEITLARTLDTVSVTEVIEFGQTEGLFEECKGCDHPKVLHIDQKAMERRERGSEIGNYIGACFGESCDCKSFVSSSPAGSDQGNFLI